MYIHTCNVVSKNIFLLMNHQSGNMETFIVFIKYNFIIQVVVDCVTETLTD